MKGLIAKRPILYRGRMYKAGENLPGDATKMVAAWLENDSAELCGEAKSADRGGQEAAQEPENAPEVSERTREQETRPRAARSRPRRAEQRTAA